MITIAGCGPGAPDLITPAARTAAVAARLLIGSERLLRCFPEATGQCWIYRGDTAAALNALATGARPACVLVSGDPGLCSLARPILDRFGHTACRIIPGISCVQAACAAAGLDWLGAVTVSCHGCEPPLVDPATLRSVPLVAVLANTPAARAWIADLHGQLGDQRRVIVCERVSLPDESVREIPAADLPHYDTDALTVILMSKQV